jgi:hypothetical protein
MSHQNDGLIELANKVFNWIITIQSFMFRQSLVCCISFVFFDKWYQFVMIKGSGFTLLILPNCPYIHLEENIIALIETKEAILISDTLVLQWGIFCMQHIQKESREIKLSLT